MKKDQPSSMHIKISRKSTRWGTGGEENQSRNIDSLTVPLLAIMKHKNLGIQPTMSMTLHKQ